ncbi:MAG: poly-gamma-glutamate hydrolase family protein [Chloroflexota bacterium]|nr:poly-gamma-glutamate hydrolase family protein [Chloroflexota bacterium]
MDDRYTSFAELAASQVEGLDYDRILVPRDSDIAVIAPHGGGIEQGTSEIAEAVAGRDCSLYCFKGTKRSGNRNLHIASTRFDDPECLALVRQSRVVVAIHGLEREDEAISVGGLDESLKGRLLEALNEGGFEAREDRSHHSGTYPSNLCNRGVTGKGVQVEIPRGLRRTMFQSLDRRGRRCRKTPFHEFVSVIRDVLFSIQ